DASAPICICAMLGAEAPSLPPEVAWEVRLHFNHLVGWLESVIAEGEAGQIFRLQTTPAAEAQAFMATVHGALLSARACDNPALFELIVGAALQRLTAPR